MTRYVFLTGTGRCGSSLVQEILARHPDIGFVSNLEDNGLPSGVAARWNNQIYRRVPQALTRKGRLRFAPSEAYRILETEVSPLVVEPGGPLLADDVTPWLATRFQRFFADRAAAQAKPAFLHKFTGWPRCALIDAVFAEAQHIHIVRDPRAVVSSLLQMPWWQDFNAPWLQRALGDDAYATWADSNWSVVLLAGLIWQAEIHAHDAARDAAGHERWLELRYEDILADPAETFGQMLDRAGVDPSAEFDATVADYRLNTDRTTAYRRELTGAQIAMLDQALAPTMARLGYEPDPTATG